MKTRVQRHKCTKLNCNGRTRSTTHFCQRSTVTRRQLVSQSIDSCKCYFLTWGRGVTSQSFDSYDEFKRDVEFKCAHQHNQSKKKKKRQSQILNFQYIMSPKKSSIQSDDNVWLFRSMCCSLSLPKEGAPVLLRDTYWWRWARWSWSRLWSAVDLSSRCGPSHTGWARWPRSVCGCSSYSLDWGGEGGGVKKVGYTWIQYRLFPSAEANSQLD